MTLSYFRDHIFDLVNESDLLDVTDIKTNERNNGFCITVSDGSVFIIQCIKIENNKPL